MTTAELVAVTVIALALIGLLAYVVSTCDPTPPPRAKRPAMPMWTSSGPTPTAEIWISRQRMGGTPCIFGTRIPTDVIAAFKDDPNEAGRHYPGITPEHVEAAAWWEARNG